MVGLRCKCVTIQVGMQHGGEIGIGFTSVFILIDNQVDRDHGGVRGNGQS